MNNNVFSGATLHTTSRILQALLRHGPLSRTQICTTLGLDKSIISKITSLLIEKEIVVIQGEGDISSRGGRRQIFLYLNREITAVAGIDLTTNTACLRFYGLKGNIIEGKGSTFPDSRSPETSALLLSALKNEQLLAGCGICSNESGELEKFPTIKAGPEACLFALSPQETPQERLAFFNLKQPIPGRIEVSLSINGDGPWKLSEKEGSFPEVSLNEFYSAAGFILDAGSINKAMLYGLPEETARITAEEIRRRTKGKTVVVSIKEGSPDLTEGAAMLFLQHLFDPETELLAAYLNGPHSR